MDFIFTKEIKDGPYSVFLFHFTDFSSITVWLLVKKNYFLTARLLNLGNFTLPCNCNRDYAADQIYCLL